MKNIVTLRDRITPHLISLLASTWLIAAALAGCNTVPPAPSTSIGDGGMDGTTSSGDGDGGTGGMAGSGSGTGGMAGSGSGTGGMAGAGGSGGSIPCGMLTWTSDKTGEPQWEVVDWQLYSGPVGTQATGFQESLASILKVWPDHHYVPAMNIIGPNVAHAPPYDMEASNGVLAAGFVSCGNFAQAQWKAPAGLMWSSTIVPLNGSPLGKTPDGDGLPMIPDSVTLFVDADLLKDGVVIDPEFGDGPYLKAATVMGDATIEGYSHMLLNFFENTSFIDGTAGNYSFRVKIYEQGSGAGYTISVPFTIQP